MHKVFSNIVDNPNEPKYRKLKINTKFYNNYIANFPDVLEFMSYAGFKNSEENFLINNSPIESVQDIFNSLTEFSIFHSKKLFFLIRI